MTAVSTDLATALDEAIARFAAANPRSAERYRQAAAWMPGANTRTALYYSPFPVTFRSGEGQRLVDLDDHTYTDFLGEYSAGLFGHSHPTILAAAREALDVGLALGGPNEFDAELAALLCERFSSVELVRFTNSGTEANLLALATARVTTGRTHVLVFDGGYHGSVLSFRGASPINVPYPVVVGTFNDAAGATALIERHAHELAAVIVEPMLGGGGAIPGTPEFLHAVRDATRRHDVVLIFDEVMTSRLAPGGYQQLVGIRPDLTTFGKYVGGGFSFGAFGGARELMQRYDPAIAGSLTHPGTFNNNALTMAAGAAGLRDVYTPEVAVAHNARGDALRDALNRLFTDEGVAMQATGLGSLIGFHFQTSPIAKPADVVPADGKRALVHLEMMARGFYFARRSYLALSVVLEPSDVDGFLAAFADVVETHREVLEQ